MAIFGTKKKKETKVVTQESAASVVSNVATFVSDAILNPRVTEKSHSLAEESNVFVFNVESGATKGKVREAVKKMFKVTPIKVSIVSVPRKKRFSRGKIGFSKGGRKAYVYLKKGEKLETA